MNFNFCKKVKLNFKSVKQKLCVRHVSVVSEYPVPVLTTNILKEKLKSYNMTFVDGHTCFRLPECRMCGPLKKKSSSGALQTFVNKQTGYFLCELCKCSAPWDVLERLILRSRDEKERTSKEVQLLREGCLSYYEKGQQSWKKIVEDSSPLHSLNEQEFVEVFERFRFRLCSQPLAEKLGIRISLDGAKLYLPITSAQTVLGYIETDVNGKSSVVPRQNCAGFVVHAPKKKQSSAIIVSNLRDFFAMLSVDVGAKHLICLPYGTSNLPQVSLPFLENYETLTLWFGSVACSWDASRSFAKKLNEKRCLVIRSSDQQFTPEEAASSNANVRQLLDQALPTWHQAITSFASLRNDVLQEVRNHEEVLGVKWKRYPALNKILRGHRRGELTVLTGPTGSGKTTFMAEYSLDLASQGVNTLWGSFEVRNVRLAKTMLQQFIGRPLETNLDKYEEWADDFQKLPIYYLTFHGQQSIPNVMDAVQHAAYIYDIGHVVIDNVQFMIGMTEEDRYNDRFHKQDLIIHAFRTFATRSNCHVTLVIHPRKERDSEELTATSIFGGAKAAQEADNILIIQDKRLTNVKGKKYLQVCKNRYTGDLGIMVLNFDKDSLSYSHKKKNPEESAVSQGYQLYTLLPSTAKQRK